MLNLLFALIHFCIGVAALIGLVAFSFFGWQPSAQTIALFALYGAAEAGLECATKALGRV